MTLSTITRRRSLISYCYYYYATASAASPHNTAVASSTPLKSSLSLLHFPLAGNRLVQASPSDFPRIPGRQYHGTSIRDTRAICCFKPTRCFSCQTSFVSTFSRPGWTIPRPTFSFVKDYKDSNFFRSLGSGSGSGNYKIVHLNTKKSTNKEEIGEADDPIKNRAEFNLDLGNADERNSESFLGEQLDDDSDEDDSHGFDPPNATIKSETLAYLQNVIIQYNLCPFASHPLRENNLKISTVRGSDDEFVAASIAYELAALSGEDVRGTTLLVAPEYYPDDFERYLGLVQSMEEDFMEEHELKGIVQIAPFHPKFRFEGSEENDVDNFTNRSPYPMFHILREDEVANAVNRLSGDASKVWGRNVKLLKAMEEKLGREGVERAMKGEKVDGMRELLKEVKLTGFVDDENNGDGNGNSAF